MVKILLKQLILEECIDTLFNNIKHNFTTLNEDLIVTTRILKETHEYIKYICYVTFIHNNKTYKFKSPEAEYIIKGVDPFPDLNSMLKEAIIKRSRKLNITILEFLTTSEQLC
jgi:hypothetical protein